MNKKKIICIAISAIILIGLIISFTLKFNYSLEYDKNTRLDIYLGKEYEINEVEQISKDVFNEENVIVQKVEIFNDMVAITVKEASDEQIDNLLGKINEKYETEIKKENIKIVDVPRVSLVDLLEKYVLPITIAVILILAYISIRYRKLGTSKVTIRTLAMIGGVELLYVSIIAITRIPVSRYTIPTGLTIGMLVLIYLVNSYENKLTKKLEESNKKKK